MGKNNVKVDNYGCLILSTPKSCNIDKKLKSETSTFLMTDLYFACNCKKNEDGTRDLYLPGNILQKRIGRRFKSWDVPYLSLFLTKNPDVVRLILPFNKIDSAGFMNLINYTSNHDHIIELDLKNNEIGSLGINYLYCNQDKLKLQILRLSGNKLKSRSSGLIAEVLLNNSTVQQLDIADVDQNEGSLVYFTTILRTDQTLFNETLKILDLSRPIPLCQYIKFDSRHIAESIGSMLRHNSTLQELHLRKFGFSCHDIEEVLENAKYNTTLRNLDLRCNNIGNYGAELLSKWLKEKSPLRALLLGHNIISNAGIKSLSEGLKFSKIMNLDVSHNQFDNEGGFQLVQAIRKNPILEKLRIFGNKIGNSTAKIIDLFIKAEILHQDNVDVKIYKIDGTFFCAFNQFLDKNIEYCVKNTICNICTN